MLIKQGDIVLTKGDGFISDTIEDITGSPYSHVAGVVKTNVIIEAMGFEHTGYEALDKYNGCADIFTCPSLTDKQRHEIVKYVESQVGSHYDYLLLFWELIRYVFHVSLPFKEKFNSHICSTLWCDAFRSVDVDLCPGIKYPSPKDISESKLLKKIGSI
jgi:uncharacterized protein YycO